MSDDNNYIAQSDAAKASPYEEASWYRPNISTAEISEYLDKAPAGAFVIRNPPHPAKNTHKATMALSVQAGPRVCNVLLRAFKHSGKIWWQIQNEFFQDITDLVLYGTNVPFNFPKLEGSGNITLSLDSAEKAEEQFQEREAEKIYHKQSKVAKKSSYLDATWYRPEFTQQQINDYLETAEHGAFIIRLPPHAVKGAHEKTVALSVQAGPRVCNVLLRAYEHSNTIWWNVTNHYFEDLTDLVIFGTETAFNFPKLEGSGLVTLNLKSAKKAETLHQTMQRSKAKEAKRKKSLMIKSKKEEDAKKAKEAKEVEAQATLTKKKADDAAAEQKRAEEAEVKAQQDKELKAVKEKEEEEERIKDEEERKVKDEAKRVKEEAEADTARAKEAERYAAKIQKEKAAAAEKERKEMAKLQKAEALKAGNLKGRESTKNKTDSTQMTEAEKAKALKQVEQNAKDEFGINEGDEIDPTRDIGDISSQATWEKDQPEWMKKKLRKSVG